MIKKKIMHFLISFILVIGFMLSSVVNSSNPKNELLESILCIDGEKIMGTVNSIIIPMKDYIFFFNEKGKCVKKIATKEGFEYSTSSNSQYIAITEGIKEGEKVLPGISLFNFNGQLIWRTKLTDWPNNIKVSDDGKRVLITQLLYEELEYPILKYFDDKGKEIVSIEGMWVVNDGNAVSSNCKYFITQKEYPGQSPKKWIFYGFDGKKIKEENVNGKELKSLGDNGNYLFFEEKGDNKRRFFLSNIKGDSIKAYSAEEVFLTNDGRVSFYTNKDFYFDDGVNVKKVLDSIVQQKTGKRMQILDNMSKNISYNGNFAIITVDAKELLLVLLFDDGNVHVKNMGIKNSGIKYELFNQKDLLVIYNLQQTKANFYKIGVSNK